MDFGSQGGIQLHPRLFKFMRESESFDYRCLLFIWFRFFFRALITRVHVLVLLSFFRFLTRVENLKEA